MEIVKLYFLYLSVLVIKLTGCVRASYQFKVEKIRSIEKSFRITYRGKYSEHTFAEMKLNVRSELCLEAQAAHTSLSGMDGRHIVLEAEVWVIRYFDSDKDLRDIVIKCPTMPISYLRLENRNKTNRVNIMLIQNISERYQFEREFVKSVSLVEITIPVNESSEEETEKTGFEDMPEDDLSFWTTEDRLNLCIAARNYVRNSMDENMVISQRNFAEKPEIYEFTYSKKKIEKLIAVKCPTVPDMYIHLDEEHQDLIKVVLLTEDFPTFVASSSSSRKHKS